MKISALFFSLATLISTSVFASGELAADVHAPELPNSAVTPGALNPAVTQATIQSTICKIGYTATIRPAGAYTNKLKLTQMAEMKLPGKPSDYELDHLISLELGGNSSDPKNLWPQPWKTASGNNAHKKDVLETYLKRQVCAGRVTLAAAQYDISANWIDAYTKYIPKNKQK